MSLEINDELIDSCCKSIENDATATLGMYACWKADPSEVCMKRNHCNTVNHVFSHKVETEGTPITNQKSSGRCWIFACLNVMRVPLIKHLKLEEFEFSQSHLFFWDKIERMNYLLNKMVELAKRGEEVEGRLVSFLLRDPTCDGGQWDMIVNIIEKHGVMPKKCFPDSFCSENSQKLNYILKTKFREYTREIRTAVAKESDDDAITALLKRQMSEIFRIVSVCLGIPPKTFTWEYYDKSKTYHKIGPISPLDFYTEHIKPIYNLEDKVCLVTDPRPNSPYDATFTVDCLGNMVGGKATVYNNQPVEKLMSMAAESIINNECVWFGCEVMKRHGGKLGFHDIDMHDYKSLFGVDVHLGLSKADRLIYGDSLMTHAMAFTGVTVDDNGLPLKWRVENSWGDDRGEKGYHVITSNWFKEFVFEVVVDKKYVPDEVLAVFGKEPILLPAWDPLGALASLA